MLDIFEIAREEALEEGKALGALEGRREMLIDAMIERFSAIPTRTLEQVRAMQNPDALRLLHRQAMKCQNLPEFEDVLRQMQ